ncbi:MAG: prepilin-type N-terminal cleavage/methylation domain-containing protein [Planctomycetota bacterium]
MKVISKQQNNNRTLRCRRGFTLTEVMISMLITMVLATGTMGYQYHSMRNVKVSEVQAAASRVAMLLLEGWKGQQGSTRFDPAAVFGGEIVIQTTASGPDAPNNLAGVPLTHLDFYKVIFQHVHYFVTLSYEMPSGSEPMLLNATVAWRRDYAQGEFEGSEPFVRYSAFTAH